MFNRKNGKAFIFAFFTLANVTPAFSVDQAADIGGAYYCVEDAAGGMSFNKILHKWVGTAFDPSRKFVLRLRSIETYSKKYLGTEMQYSDYHVTIIDIGTKYPADCYALRDIDWGKDGDSSNISVGNGKQIDCNDGAYIYRFNMENLRFLTFYIIGYSDGLDNNDNTPSAAGGRCTKIE